MSYCKAKMHQIRFPLGLIPRPRWGSLHRSPDQKPTSKRRKRKREGTGKEGRWEGKRSVGEGKGCRVAPQIADSGSDSEGGWEVHEKGNKRAWVGSSRHFIFHFWHMLIYRPVTEVLIFAMTLRNKNWQQELLQGKGEQFLRNFWLSATD